MQNPIPADSCGFWSHSCGFLWIPADSGPIPADSCGFLWIPADSCRNGRGTQPHKTPTLNSAKNSRPLIPADDPVIQSSSPAHPHQNYIIERVELAQSAYIQVDGKLQKLRHRHKLTPDQWQSMYHDDEIRGHHIRIELFTHLGHATKVTIRYLGLLITFAAWVALLYGMIHVRGTGWKVVMGVVAAVVWDSGSNSGSCTSSTLCRAQPGIYCRCCGPRFFNYFNFTVNFHFKNTTLTLISTL
ncbi:uncharacterized protein LACBIDRAFT_321139 [Laccaria bicolor S238N-H82]|uniref:Predicted protein n=1 Tax=Laccaria bicolor (strain S238N-H82 / ATCC MYA-4686) TaxID=486041 RepID=B0CNW1_LACBS|nr:uncharacterized protein LACBIDRAFT_321139 [Laccaria bicolor S238N-H82]EDR15360.1 predicted protein [Laccaria bicolor S238N-H82]|eukprot:XP_001873568.1 predicted protein [Laccaria bicolor S238N-H82]